MNDHNNFTENTKKNKHFLHIAVLCMILTTATLCGCQADISGQHTPISKSGFALDTFITVTIYDSTDTDLLDTCFSLCDTYEQLFSRTITGSDIDRINQAGGSLTTVSGDTFSILQKSVYYGDLSDGAFDITIAPVSSQWDFTSEDPVLPDDDAIKAALPLISYQNIVLDEKTQSVSLKDPNSAIDLGAIAKGYIADKLKEYLAGEGVTSAIIDLGGNILTVGEKLDGSDFCVGIKEPFSKTGEVAAAVYVKDKSVVTSGTYQRCFTLDGTLYHHILDPCTGYPVNTDLNSVTIISGHSVDGDALSTTCMLLGMDKGLTLIEGLPDTEAIFITTDNALVYSSGMDAYLASP